MKKKTLSYYQISAVLWVAIGLTSCGLEEPLGPAFQVQILMPKTLTRSEDRYQRFLARVTHLKVKLSSPSGGEMEKVFAPQDWTNMTLAMVSVSDNEKVKITAEIWDKTPKGTLRPFSVMRGEASVDAKLLDEAPGPVIPISMTLRVSVTDYD